MEVDVNKVAKAEDNHQDGSKINASVGAPHVSVKATTEPLTGSPSVAAGTCSTPGRSGPASPPVKRTKVERCYVRCLRRLGGKSVSRHVILETGKNCWVGRSDDNQLCLPDVILSRKQAEIKEEAPDLWTVTDNKSANGTWINNEKLDPMQSRRLNDKDIIQFGPAEIQAEKGFQFMFHRALKFRLHPSIPTAAIVDEAGNPLDVAKRRKLNHPVEAPTIPSRLKEITTFKRQLIEMEERLKYQDEEMNEMKLEAAKSLEAKLAEEEAKLRLSLLEDSEKKKHEMEQEMRQEFEAKENKLENEKEKLKLAFEVEKENLESQLKSAVEKEQSSKDELLASLALKEEELNLQLIAANKKFEEERKDMEQKIVKELEVKKQQEEKRIQAEMEQQRAEIINEQQRKEKELEDRKKRMERELQQRQEETEKQRREMEEKMAEELKKKEENIKLELDAQKQQLMEEAKNIEIQLKSEFNQKLEEKDKEKERELVRQRDHIAAEIQKRQCKEAELEKALHLAKNSKNDSEMSSRQKILSNLEETMESELQCAICTELLIEATALNCSHSFCQYCIKEWRKKKNDCPVCRKKITTETRALVLDSYIDKMVAQLGDEMKERRKENVKFREEQKAGKPAAVAANTTNPNNGSGSSGTTAAVVNVSSDSEEEDSNDNSNSDSDSSGSMSGDPGAYYGGYGNCYICGRRGHWAPGCPDRY